MSATSRPSKIAPRPGDVAPKLADTRRGDGNHRDRSLLDLAHGLHECTLQIEGVCAGHSPHGCEPAHSNNQVHGKGARIKAHDNFHAAACHACHAEIDQGMRLGREEKARIMQRGIDRTMLEYFKRGWIGVTEQGRKRK